MHHVLLVVFQSIGSVSIVTLQVPSVCTIYQRSTSLYIHQVCQPLPRN